MIWNRTWPVTVVYSQNPTREIEDLKRILQDIEKEVRAKETFAISKLIESSIKEVKLAIVNTEREISKSMVFSFHILLD